MTIGTGFTMKPHAYIAVMDGDAVTVGKGVSLARNSIVVCHDSIAISDRVSIASQCVDS